MNWWTNDKGERLFVAAHELVDCRTLLDEHPTFCLGGLAWVPCSERMPDNGVEVLVAVWPSVYIAEREDGEWWAVDRTPSALGGVTHWMPLPQPPKA